jgi:hypothetical protein
VGHAQLTHGAQRHRGAGGCLGVIYSTRSTEMIVWIEYFCPTLRKVPITRHLPPTEQGLSGSRPDPVRSIVQM